MDTQVVEVTGRLAIDMACRHWCLRAYPDHPNGCPNYGKKAGCPPAAPRIMDVLNLSRPHWLAITTFDLGSHIIKMKDKHPAWSERQARCCLYWQGAVRKQLHIDTNLFMEVTPDTVAYFCPEAMGVHVFDTARAIGYPLERPPVNLVRTIALVGYRA